MQTCKNTQSPKNILADFILIICLSKLEFSEKNNKETLKILMMLYLNYKETLKFKYSDMKIIFNVL